MGSDPPARRIPGAWCCFNPRSHMGSDIITVPLLYKAGVSIHAPTWGATIGYGDLQLLDVFQSTLPHGERRQFFNILANSGQVSIHAPTWGATDYIVALVEIILFQSTLPHGERLLLLQEL